MKFAMTMILGMAFVAAFADGKGCCAASGGCCQQAYYKASALGSKDAEFLAMANAMAANAEGKKVGCSMHAKAAKKSAKKGAKAAKSCCAK
jgi:hypothetical protein